MEPENFEQTGEKRIEPKIHVSRDGKWVIEKIPRSEIELFLKDQPESDVVIIKPVSFWNKVMGTAKTNAGYNVEQVKG